jgi:serine/threonine-protein kinase RsbW
VEIKYGLRLPREAATVPVVRGLIRSSLGELGVRTSCVHDIALALTEACANVVEHAEDADDEFDVEVQIDSRRCRIRVVDTGAAFEPDLDGGMPGTGSERGRGIQLMRALVDVVRFEALPGAGNVVEFHKVLDLEDTSPLYQPAFSPRGAA